jgi:hypothetical protein
MFACRAAPGNEPLDAPRAASLSGKAALGRRNCPWSLESIDGGYEFNGWLGYDPNYQTNSPKGPWWVKDDEYRIASGPMRGYSVLRVYPFRRLLIGQESAILVLRRNPQ